MSDFKRHERSGGGRGDDRRGDDRRGGFGGDYRRGGDEGRRDEGRRDDRRGDGRRPRQPAVAISDNAVNTENFKNDEEGDHLSQPIESFEQLNVSEPLLRGIYSYGFEKPSPIQQSAIRPFLAGRDVIAQAQSGTGKTGSFCIGVLGRLDPALNATQAIILSNTRELALQIDMVFRQLGNYMGLRCNLSVKGVSIEENIESLTKADKPHVVIGTAGRVLDMVNKRALDTKKIAMLVIDEADEMLSKCFLEQIYDIFTQMPETTQVGLYSATMGENFFSITKRFMRNPVYILVKAEQLTLEGIKQFYVNMDKAEYKFDTLCDIYSVITISQCIIYCNNRRGVEELTQRMTENNFTVSSIHGDMSPNEREITMADFRGGKTRVLISTDLLSRGIDVQQVSIVINYDIPIRVDNYLHRIGRSGRYGRKGVAINFRTFYDSQRIKSIEQYYNTKIEEMPLDLQSYIRAID
jgi:translation initiation factor 4A